MSTTRDPYQRLVRWYPRSWRAGDGEVLLGTLREADEDAGLTRPTRADAWSLRVHGCAERFTPAAGQVLATAGAAASLVVLVITYALLGRSVESPSTGWALLSSPASLVQLVATATAPAAVSLGVVAFLRRSRVLSDPAAVLVAVVAVMAWGLAALTSASWGVGFERADAGLEPTSFTAATWPLFLAATAVGTVAAAAVWDGVLAGVPALRGARGRSSGARLLVRRLLAVVLGAVCTVVLGLGASAPGSVLVAGAVVAAACLLGHRSASTSGAQIRARRVPVVPRRRRPLVADGRRAAVVGLFAATALVLGVAATAHALWGAIGQGALVGLPVPLAALPPMNLGLAVGSVVAVPVVVAVALLVAPRRGWRARSVVGAIVVAFLLRAVSAATGPSGDAGTSLLFAGGLLLGVAATAPLARILPGGAVLRWATTALLGVALGLVAGTGVLAMAPLLTPVAAGAVLVALVVSAVRVRRSEPGAEPAMVGQPCGPEDLGAGRVSLRNHARASDPGTTRSRR